MFGGRICRFAFVIGLSLCTRSVARAGGLEPEEAGSAAATPGSSAATPGSNHSEPPNPPAPVTGSGGLDFDSAELPPGSVTSATSDGSDHSKLWASLAVGVMGGLVGAAAIVGRRRRSATIGLDLHAVPLSAKLALTLLLLIYGVTHVVAALTGYLDTRVVYSTTAEYFRFLKPPRLSALSHAHLMAIATMDGIVALFYAWTRRSGALACAVITMTFVGVAADIAAWWLIKYAGPGFEWMSIAAGIAFSLGFAVMAFALLRTAWLRKETA
jgi:hypothetical protein